MRWKLLDIYRELRSMGEILETIGRSISLLLPPSCLICGRNMDSSILCGRCDLPLATTLADKRCERCFSAIDPTSDDKICKPCTYLPLPYNQVRYLWEYTDEVQRYVTTMKYSPSQFLSNHVGRRVAATLPLIFNHHSWDLLVPLPTSHHSAIRRGFNQCGLIAHQLLQSTTGSILQPSALRHRSNRPRQATLPTRKRLRGFSGVFQASSDLLRDRSVLLIDDIITTGSTIHEAALTLREAGALTVDVLALARLPLWSNCRGKIYKLARKRLSEL